MMNTKTLKLKRVFNLREYLQEKAKIDREYREYVEESIKEAEEDFKNGRYYTLEEIKIELHKDLKEYEMVENE